MKVLVIRFSSIGDIVLTTPVMRCIKKQIPGAQLHFLTKKSMKAVTEENPYIDKFFYYDENLSTLKQQLQQEQYDYVVDLHKNFRSYMIRWSLKAKSLSYNKLSIEKFLLTKFHINKMPGRHITVRSLDAVAILGVKDDGEGLDYFINEKDILPDEAIPLTHRFGFIAIVIGASYYTKKLPVPSLIDLCKHLNFPIVLVGGKEDFAEGKAIADKVPVKVFNACGMFNLNQSADIVRNARLVISHDTGLQYIACAFNKPVLAIWGGTSPKLDVEPFYGTKAINNTDKEFKYKNFVVEGLNCQPCSNYGTKKCPQGHFKCMFNQDIDEIIDMAYSILR